MSFRITRSNRAALAFLLAATAVATLSAQRSTQPRRLLISSVHGPDLFHFYCGSCHGPDGRGGGPTAPALKLRVPDLTMMASREGGVFPRARVVAVVTGDQAPAIPAHGSKEMPVWGPIFRALDPGDAMNKVRIDNIVTYVETLQVRAR